MVNKNEYILGTTSPAKNEESASLDIDIVQSFRFFIACSHRRHGVSPCRRCKHNWRQDKIALSGLDPVFSFQVFSSPQYIWDWTVANWKLGRDKTKLSCLVTNSVHTADTDKTRQFCLVRIGGVNKLLSGYLYGLLEIWDLLPTELWIYEKLSLQSSRALAFEYQGHVG